MKPFSFAPVIALAAVLAITVLPGCIPQQPEKPEKTAKSSSETSAAKQDSAASQAHTLATETASYTLSGFESLPGWQRNKLSQIWPTFLLSCQALDQRDTAWRRICQQARQLDGNNNSAIHAFFEREFLAYQIRDTDQRPDGVIAGYFESEIAGSRKYQPPYIYPVYGQPTDMLYLDTRKLPSGNGVVPARVQGREVRVQSDLSTRDIGGTGIYVLDLSQIPRNTLERKIRLRADNQRLLPYYTRQEIETHGAPGARVLAFVRNAAELYEMQIQGSGRIRLPDGSVIRLEYAEHNGHPFRPMLASSAKVRTRGDVIELEASEADASDKNTDKNVTGLRWVRGFRLALPAKSGPVAVPGRSNAGAGGSGNTDPSYVFFKKVSSNTDGPSGTLGVPLQPGYSIAVDSRSIPLGYPVFVSTHLRNGAPMQRLLMAQDTGNAVRGALRADYFFGNGQEAARQARLMKQQSGQLWVLLPRGQTVTTAPSAARTHGGLPQCLVPDENICTND